MRLSQELLSGALAMLLNLPSISAQSVIGDISIGHEGPLSRDRMSIPNWKLTGDTFQPTIYSDRLLLTPPYPGNARGALWANNVNPSAEFTVDFEFRTSGPERASGNLQVWYVKDKPENDHASVYTINTFDGLALVIDQYGQEGGSIRGFLNDGTTSFKATQSVDSLAFGHCHYSYRNLGRYSRLRISQGANGLVVSIDDRVCFQTGEVNLPASYYFGISAASAENPDSFEISKFAVSAGGPPTIKMDDAPQMQQGQPVQGQPQQGHMQQGQPQQQILKQEGVTLPPKRRENNAQDNQVIDALRQIESTVSAIQKGASTLQSTIDTKLGNMPVGQLLGAIQGIERRLGELEKNVQKIKTDVEGRDYKQSLSSLQQALADTQSKLGSLPTSMGEIVNTSAPRMGFFIFVILGFQVALVISYIIYKRRRANMPKKFL